MPRANVYSRNCPSRDILELIGSKWSMMLLCVLREGPCRTQALKRRLDGISQKMLTQTLRDLTKHGIVKRIDYEQVPPHIEYRLTARGESLSDLVQQIENWVKQHYTSMVRTADAYAAEPRNGR